MTKPRKTAHDYTIQTMRLLTLAMALQAVAAAIRLYGLWSKR